MFCGDTEGQCLLRIAYVLVLFTGLSTASIGDRLPEFKSCVAVGLRTDLMAPRGWSRRMRHSIADSSTGLS